MVEQYNTSFNLEAEHYLSAKKLEEARRSGVKLIGADYDGTLYDKKEPPYDDHLRVIRLVDEVSRADVDFSIISARNTTLHVPFRELASAYSQEAGRPLTLWTSGGNGMNLSRVTFSAEGQKVEPIFTNFITPDQAELIVFIFDQMFHELGIEPDARNVAFFKAFLDRDLPEDLVPRPHRQLVERYGGRYFAEAVKVTTVLPTSKEQQAECIVYLRERLEIFGFNIGWGGIAFADVSRRMLDANGKPIDGKVLVLETILARSNFAREQVTTFGDAPNGNDMGLLGFPKSFTNAQSFNKNGLESPPFMLKIKDSPVGTIHEAIRYLTS